jgi:hypothetical protein
MSSPCCVAPGDVFSRRPRELAPQDVFLKTDRNNLTPFQFDVCYKKPIIKTSLLRFLNGTIIALLCRKSDEIKCHSKKFFRFHSIQHLDLNSVFVNPEENLFHSLEFIENV